MADAQIEYGGMASEDINDWKELASDILKGTPSIDLEADYVPKDFHDKTCEAMAKAHQEELADMVSVVRCKECVGYSYSHPYDMPICTILSGYEQVFSPSEDDYCSYGKRSK